MRVIICRRKGGATVWAGDAETVAEALDTYAREIGFSDDLDRWAEEGPGNLRVFAHDGLQLQEVSE